MLKKNPNTILGGLLGASLLLSFDVPAHAASLAECDYDEDKISISCRDWSVRLSGRFHMDTLFDATDDSNPQFVQGQHWHGISQSPFWILWQNPQRLRLQVCHRLLRQWCFHERFLS